MQALEWLAVRLLLAVRYQLHSAVGHSRSPAVQRRCGAPRTCLVAALQVRLPMCTHEVQASSLGLPLDAPQAGTSCGGACRLE